MTVSKGPCKGYLKKWQTKSLLGMVAGEDLKVRSNLNMKTQKPRIVK